MLIPRKKDLSLELNKAKSQFVSGKHFQQDARKCADRLNSERKFGKTLASMQTGRRYYSDHTKLGGKG